MLSSVILLKLIIGAVWCRLLPFGAGRSSPERIGGLLDSWIVEEDATGLLHGCTVAWLHGVFDGSIVFWSE